MSVRLAEWMERCPGIADVVFRRENRRNVRLCGCAEPKDPRLTGMCTECGLPIPVADVLKTGLAFRGASLSERLSFLLSGEITADLSVQVVAVPGRMYATSEVDRAGPPSLSDSIRSVWGWLRGKRYAETTFVGSTNA